MKKNYQSAKAKRTRNRKAKRKLKQVKRKKKELQKRTLSLSRAIELGRPIKNSTYKKGLQKRKKHRRRKVIAPKTFDLFNNPEGTIQCFSKIHNLAVANKKILLDMSETVTLGPEVILYLLSRFEFYNKSYFNIKGNMPRSPQAQNLLSASGFYEYVKTQNKPSTSTNNILTIKSGTLVDGMIAKEANTFSKTQLNAHKNEKIIYPILIECMANTKNHAYLKRNQHSKWWLFASYCQMKKSVRFIFLDNGTGIPATMKKKPFEFRGITVTDSKLIEAALNPNINRTQTKLQHRGKGLPKIHNFYKQKKIFNLKVMSGKGLKDYANNSQININSEFYGTLLSWEYK